MSINNYTITEDKNYPIARLVGQNNNNNNNFDIYHGSFINITSTTRDPLFNGTDAAIHFDYNYLTNILAKLY